MKNLVIILTCILFLCSCNIYRTFTFETTNTGHVDYRIDMSQLMGLSGSVQQNPFAGSEMGTNNIESMFKNIEGIKNFNSNYDSSGILTLNYDFESISALQSSLNSAGMNQDLGLGSPNSSVGTIQIKSSEKSFSMKEFDSKTLRKMKSKKSKNEYESMKSFLSSSLLVTTINFNKQVKRVSEKDFTIINDGKGFSYSKNLYEIYSGRYKPLKVTFK